MQFNLYAVALLLSAAVFLGVAFYAWWRGRSVAGAVPFAVAMALGAAWAVDYALDISNSTLDARVFWATARFPVLAFLPLAWLATAVQYTGQANLLRRWRLAALAAVPAITSVISLTSAHHTLFRYNYRLENAGPVPVLLFDNGPWFLVHAVYGYALVLLSVAMVARPLRTASRLYFRQNLMVLIALLLPAANSLLFDLRIVSLQGYNPAPATFLLTGPLLAWTLFRYRIFDVVPIARALVVENINDLVLVLDARDRILDFNRAAGRILGLDPSSVTGRAVESALGRWPDLLTAYRDVPTARGRVSREEAEGRRVYDLSVSPINDDCGRLLGRLLLLHDVTDLERAKEAAEAATRAKSAFLANMSHEIRTPLNSVLGFAQLMRRDPNLTPTQSHHLARIRSGGEHLLSLLNDILDMSKIEAGRMVLQSRPFDLHCLLAGLDELLHERAESKGLALRVEWAADVPRDVVGDEGKLRQILVNLVGNAIKFTSQGSVAVRAEPLPVADDVPHRRIRFSVEDTGAGIAPQEMATLFEPFQQTESGRWSQEGTGLGLALSHQLVRLMGGEMSARSEVGQGSTFWLDVPLPAAPEDVDRTPRAEEWRVARVEQGQPARRVLVVDDDPAGRLLLVSMLGSLNGPAGPDPVIEVREAADGLGAIDTWEAWQPHLILMDMRMPRLSGKEATREIKSRLRGRPDAVATAIVAVSASAFEEDRATFLACGCDEFARKPLQEEHLVALLSRHLGLRFINAESPRKRVVPTLSLSALQKRLAACPPAWVADLRLAVELGDFDRVATLIEEIRPRDGELAAHLTDRAGNYDQDALLRLIRPADPALLLVYDRPQSLSGG